MSSKCATVLGKRRHAQHISDKMRKPRPWRSAQLGSKYKDQSIKGQDPWGDMATPSLSGGYQYPNSGFSASFLMEYTGKNTSRQ